MKIRFHKQFEKDHVRLKRGERQRVRERLSLFFRDEFDPLLNNHPLAGRYKGYRSINITGDLRAIYKRVSEEVRIFVAVGTHHKLYS